jgi:branched-chain amino acid transport system substrate-binding protein
MTTFWAGAATVAALAVAPAFAQDLFIPGLVYRTGPYAPNGIPVADAMSDYFALLNERDGGIGGTKVVWAECETAYDTKLGVECYERLKTKNALIFNPYSTGITYAMIPKATVDKIPILSMGYGRTDASDGRVFPWVFTTPTTYWSQASAKISYIASREGGIDKLKGKTLALIHHNSPYGKEPIPTLQELSKRHGFKLEILAVDHPGQEQKATWQKIQQLEPHWIFFWGWGVMNQVGVKEAAAIGFKMDRIVGVWWSGAEPDVVPAGESGKGYLSATFHGVGNTYKIHDELKKHVHDKGKGKTTWAKTGEVLYIRGLVNALITAEGVRNGVAIAAKEGKPVTGEHVRQGMEDLNLDDAALDRLGFKGLIRPMKNSCADHEGNGPILIQQWDGKQWKIVTDWIAPMRDVVRPMIEESAAKFAKENNITARADCK